MWPKDDIGEDLVYSLRIRETTGVEPIRHFITVRDFAHWKVTIFAFKQPKPEASPCHMERSKLRKLCLLLALEKCSCTVEKYS